MLKKGLLVPFLPGERHDGVGTSRHKKPNSLPNSSPRPSPLLSVSPPGFSHTNLLHIEKEKEEFPHSSTSELQSERLGPETAARGGLSLQKRRLLFSSGNKSSYSRDNPKFLPRARRLGLGGDHHLAAGLEWNLSALKIAFGFALNKSQALGEKKIPDGGSAAAPRAAQG